MHKWWLIPGTLCLQKQLDTWDSDQTEKLCITISVWIRFLDPIKVCVSAYPSARGSLSPARVAWSRRQSSGPPDCPTPLHVGSGGSSFSPHIGSAPPPPAVTASARGITIKSIPDGFFSFLFFVGAYKKHHGVGIMNAILITPARHLGLKNSSLSNCNKIPVGRCGWAPWPVCIPHR